ncbi:MAG: histidine phosphatase family protein [Chloroflexi bacterium]|nr:MAG: histidine phosphatase family protein [Chloroflexota bacterium]
MSRVWLIRHAASSAAAGSAIGLTDLPLSDVGHEQARSLASELASRPLVRIVSSDRRRALATANMIAVPHSGLRVESSSALREIDFGAWEGRSLNDLWVEDPAAARAWEDDIHATPASFGESVDDVSLRVVAFWRSMQPLSDAGELAIVGHRGSLAILRALITGETITDAFAVGLALGSAVALVAPGSASEA